MQTNKQKITIRNTETLKIKYLKGNGLPWGSDGKRSACNSEDVGSMHGSGRCPGGENGYPLQYFCLENPMDRGAWQVTVQLQHNITRSRTQLSD